MKSTKRRLQTSRVNSNGDIKIPRERFTNRRKQEIWGKFLLSIFSEQVDRKEHRQIHYT